jgi:hypothetical protein
METAEDDSPAPPLFTPAQAVSVVYGSSKSNPAMTSLHMYASVERLLMTEYQVTAVFRTGR